MTGDERARFCGSCHKNVYDISQMTRAQAQQLIAEKEGDLCLRLHRRPDGTVITSDCPVGITATPRPLWWGAVAALALLSSGLAGCAASGEVAQIATPATVAPVVSLANRKVEMQQTAPIIVETPAMKFDNAAPVTFSNRPDSNEPTASVTLGVPMMPPPQTSVAPQPTHSPAPPPVAVPSPNAQFLDAQYPDVTRDSRDIAPPIAPDAQN